MARLPDTVHLDQLTSVCACLPAWYHAFRAELVFSEHAAWFLGKQRVLFLPNLIDATLWLQITGRRRLPN